MDNELLQNCKKDFDIIKFYYQKMKDYYDNETDAKKNYRMITSRSNLFTDTNYIQKFIQEEANYCCLNKITYSSYSNDLNIVELIRNSFKTYSDGHNKELLKQALIYQEAYELHYINIYGDFASLICTPLNSYVLQDDYGNIQLFIRFFKKKFDTVTEYCDVYEGNKIYHFKVAALSFIPIGTIDIDIFSKIPVSICKIGVLSESLYCKLKGLEDSYTTNLSDQTNLNSDLRTKYLHFKDCQPTPEQLEEMKANATITTKGGGDVQWLQSDEVSFKDTLDTLQDNIYQQASHLNFNKPLQSNTSSLAIKGTLMGLNQKVGDDITAITDSIKTKLQFLFEYLKAKEGKDYDWKDIDIKTVSNTPSDDLMVAQILAQYPNISKKTGLKQFSFIDNVESEMKQLDIEGKANSIGNILLNPPVDMVVTK